MFGWVEAFGRIGVSISTALDTLAAGSSLSCRSDKRAGQHADSPSPSQGGKANQHQTRLNSDASTTFDLHLSSLHPRSLSPNVSIDSTSWLSHSMTSAVGRAGGTALLAAAEVLPPYLASLSKAQYDAVTAPPNIPLQILAGPGSGKTRVLVARVTWLILANNIRPNDLVVVTFTNKAANEMRQRLHKLIGPERTANLILGGCISNDGSMTLLY